MRLSYAIWATAFAFYLVFLAWHENWRGPLSAEEIAMFEARIEASGIASAAQRRAFSDFMRSDTGKPFVMLNLAAYPQGDVAHPLTGEMMPGRVLIQKYFSPFMGKIVLRGGYPAYMGEAVGDYLDAWKTSANPGWSGIGLIRYRSRRDLLMAATDPAFADSHIFKQAALAVTYALPTQSTGGGFLSPRIWVAMLLVSLASLAQTLLLTIRMRHVG